MSYTMIIPSVFHPVQISLYDFHECKLQTNPNEKSVDEISVVIIAMICKTLT